MLLTIVRLIFLLFVILWTVDCFFPGWRASPASWAFPSNVVSALIRWLIGMIVLFIVYLIVVALIGALAGGGGSLLGTLAFGAPLLLFGVVNPTPEPPAPNPTPEPAPNPPTAPDSLPGLPFAMAYWIGLGLTVAMVILGAIQTNYSAGNGAAMGLDQRAIVWIGIVSTALGVVARVFPMLQYTPAMRNRAFTRALQGRIPRDVHLVLPEHMD